jgi:iron-sulfur cluster assembly accessory protein
LTQETAVKPIVQLTEKAAAELKLYLSRQGKPSAALRIFVTAGGCSGLSYGMVVDDKLTEDDFVIEESGARVAVDRSSAPFIAGSTIDYRAEKLMGGGFVVTNPNAVSTCGCGESFKTAKTPGPHSVHAIT